jgi:hypothetical protein
MKVVTFKLEGSPNEKNFITMNESSSCVLVRLLSSQAIENITKGEEL